MAKVLKQMLIYNNYNSIKSCQKLFVYVLINEVYNQNFFAKKYQKNEYLIIEHIFWS